MTVKQSIWEESWGGNRCSKWWKGNESSNLLTEKNDKANVKVLQEQNFKPKRSIWGVKELIWEGSWEGNSH